MSKLTNSRDVPFEICFKYPLEKGYSFEELSQRNIKDFQRFLDKVASMTVDQVDHSFARKPDRNDSFRGNQVYHYEVAKGFRIHVVNEAGYYKVIRLDPNHYRENDSRKKVSALISKSGLMRRHLVSMKLG